MNLVSNTMTESKSFNKGIYTVFLGAFLVLFQIGIYFVYIPWNAERLQITEAEIGIGLLVFGISNLIGNQTSGRLIVPRIGTKNSIALGLLGSCLLPFISNIITKLSMVFIGLYTFWFFCWIICSFCSIADIND